MTLKSIESILENMRQNDSRWKCQWVCCVMLRYSNFHWNFDYMLSFRWKTEHTHKRIVWRVESNNFVMLCCFCVSVVAFTMELFKYEPVHLIRIVCTCFHVHVHTEHMQKSYKLPYSEHHQSYINLNDFAMYCSTGMLLCASSSNCNVLLLLTFKYHLTQTFKQKVFIWSRPNAFEYTIIFNDCLNIKLTQMRGTVQANEFVCGRS